MEGHSYNFFHRLLVPLKENDFRPLALRKRAFLSYVVLTVVTLVLLSPLRDVKFNLFLASITQDLVVAHVNPAREVSGFLPLAIDEKLTQAAQLKAEDMVVRDYFSHTGPDGERPWSWFDKVGYRYAAAGENLAIDFSDPAVLVKAWLNSPTHAKNIYNGYFNEMGVGIAHGELGGRNTTVVVLFLGREITPTLSSIIEESKPEETIPPAPEPGPVPTPPPNPVSSPPVVENPPREELQKPETLAVTPEELISVTRPEIPVVTRVVEEEHLDKEAVLVPETIPTPSLERAQSQSFVMTAGPRVLRWVLSGIFGILLGWTVFFSFLHRRKFVFFASRVAGFVLFLAVLWLPFIFS